MHSKKVDCYHPLPSIPYSDCSDKADIRETPLYVDILVVSNSECDKTSNDYIKFFLFVGVSVLYLPTVAYLIKTHTGWNEK